MGMREAMMGMLDGLLAFGRVTASKQATNTKQVLVSLEGNGGGDATPEARPFQALWGHAAIQYRPPADTEVMFARLGDEMVPIASRELRWAIDVEEGEVVLRNLVGDSSQQARIRLKANGDVVIDSPRVFIGDGSATEKMALGTAIKGHLDAIKSFLDLIRAHVIAHTHPVTGATAGQTVASPFTASPPSVPDVESRHLVEN